MNVISETKRHKSLFYPDRELVRINAFDYRKSADYRNDRSFSTGESTLFFENGFSKYPLMRNPIVEWFS